MPRSFFLHRAASLHDNGPAHFSLLMHPNVLVFSATSCSPILKTLLAAAWFSLTVLPACVIQNRFGLIIPSWNAWAVCISKLAGLTEIADPDAIPSSAPSLLADTSAHFSLPSHLCPSQAFPGLFPSLLASRATCPCINPKSFLCLPCLFLQRPG